MRPEALYAADVDHKPPSFTMAGISVRPRFIWGRGDTVLRPGIAEAMNSGSFRWFTPPPKSSTCHVINCCHALRLAATSKGKGKKRLFSFSFLTLIHLHVLTDAPSESEYGGLS